jgi:hypothetical protein
MKRLMTAINCGHRLRTYPNRSVWAFCRGQRPARSGVNGQWVLPGGGQ